MNLAIRNANELAAKGLRFCEPCRQILPASRFRIRRGVCFNGTTRAAWCGSCEVWHERVQRAKARLGHTSAKRLPRRALRQLLVFMRNITVEGVAA